MKNHFKFNYHSLLFCYLWFFVEQFIIFVNDCALYWGGVTDSIDYSNASFTYGVKEQFLEYLGFAKYLIPDIFYNNGVYTPILWMLVPMIFVVFIVFIICVVFIDREHFAKDIKQIKAYFREKKIKN